MVQPVRLATARETELRADLRQLILSPEQKAGAVLQGFAQAQFDLVQSGYFDSFRDKTHNDFIAAFRKHPLFAQVVKLGLNEVQNLSISDNEFLRRFRGAIFQRMAYAFLSTRDRSRPILSGQATTEFLKAFYGRTEAIEHPFGDTGLTHKYVPDGLEATFIDGEAKVAAALEYSVIPIKSRLDIDRKRWGFSCLRRDLRRLSSDARFVYVAPPSGDGHLDPPSSEPTLVRVPFIRQELFDFEDWVYREYAPSPELPTIAQLRKQAHLR